MGDDPERGGGFAGAAERAAGLVARFDALGRIRGRAALATVAWTVLVAAYAIGFFGASNARGTTFLDGAFFLVGWALPVILIWLAAFLAEELARLRDLAAGFGPLTAALDATRVALERHPAAPRPDAAEAAAALARLAAGQDELAQTLAARERGLAEGQAELAAALGALRAALAHPPAAPTAMAPPAKAAPAQGPARTPHPPAQQPRPAAAPAAPQAELALAEPALPWADVVRALDFPRDADDAEGFAALKAALQLRALAQMLQAAEDVLTILSQEGVYMDDLAAAPAEPEAWRRFMAGERGQGVAGIGGVTDTAALETAQALMKEDTVFRDTTLFFLRRFDAALQEIARDASEAEIAALADTRSGRAFQLMARASGAFD